VHQRVRQVDNLIQPRHSPDPPDRVAASRDKPRRIATHRDYPRRTSTSRDQQRHHQGEGKKQERSRPEPVGVTPTENTDAFEIAGH
jgi:hypothetical protein